MMNLNGIKGTNGMMDRTLLKVKQYVFNEMGNAMYIDGKLVWASCDCCNEITTSRLTIHHLSYTKDSVKYTSFTNDITGRIQYYATLMNEVIANKDNLRIMCVPCHDEMESYIREVKRGELGTLSESQERVPTHLLGMFLLTLERQGITDTG
jgi:hypothetical protein